MAAAGLLAWWLTRGDDAGAPAGTRAQNVLLITLDTTRADRIGAYGYAAARTPNLDALARSGVRFDDATVSAPITGPSHAAILTGHHAPRFGVRDNVMTPLPDEAVTIAEILADRGFSTGGFIGAFILDRPYGFAQGFGAFDGGFTRVDAGSEANAERPASAVVDDAVKWIASLDAAKPFFAWVHLYDPHAPYTPPAPFAQDYDGEIAYVDQQIGRLLESLRARQVFGRTLVAVIADHGESLGQHGEDEHGVFLYDTVLRVPFIVSGPGARPGHVVTEQVRGIDVVPTILEALGMEPPADLDGESLGPLLDGRTRANVPPSYAETHYPRLHYGWSELRSIRADGWKAIDAPRPELYNLRDDPREEKNLYAVQQPLADRMIGEAARLGRELGGGSQPPAKQPDRETLDRLRSLGYVGVSAARPSGERGPDPKDRIAERREYNRLMSEAIDALRGGRPDAAVPKFRRLIEINDRAYDVHQFLGEAYERMGRLNEALGEYEYAALLNPEAVTPHVAAAEVHLRQGDTARARKRLQEAATVEAQAFEVLMLEARILQREGRLPDALAAYERASTRNPANPRARAQMVEIAVQTGRLDVAEAQLRRLLDMGYEPARTHFGLGRVAEMRGDRAAAAAEYQRALALDPAFEPARQALAAVR
ncbi:MAG TPA: sulfatase-like hydrolase/transferase [Vicinamibacterales bacterium]|nr:sulfatase-like hydrolase/transferase [Vicinamibacterales bacterium]